MRTPLILAILTLSATALAKDEDYGGGMVVFARDGGLWKTDPHGHGPPVQVAALPGSSDDVRMIRSDRDGHTILVDLAGAWWWAKLADGDVAKPAKLACADAPARLLDDGSAVLCADADGHAQLIRLGPNTARSFPVPAAGARVVTKDGARSLIWADDRGVWRAPLAHLRKHYRLAAEAPRRGFLAAPDGGRAVAIYPGEVYEKKVKVPADVLTGFALDGKAARRMLYRETTQIIDWSWDSTWLLTQDETNGACITRAVGGEYKCWKGYTAVSLAPDGTWALVLGKRADAKPSEEEQDDDEPKGGEEGGEDEDAGDEVAPPAEQHSLYRAKLGGPRSAKPSLVETDIDGLGALWLPRVIFRIGAWFIHALIWLFGRTHRRDACPWLVGPIGGDVIGDAPYRDVAAAEGLDVERDAQRGGLIPSFEQLRGPDFDPDRAQPGVRDFYEHTAEFEMDVWSETYFPSRIGLWLLVKTISRQVDQLNFPLSPLDTARGMNSGIILMRRPDGSVRYTGWFRTTAEDRRSVYTGFYMTERVPDVGACVKAVFPMPRGSATVLLRPRLEPDGSLILDSSGRRFGDPGFYRVHARDAARLRVWYIRSLEERFHVYADDDGVVRADHTVRFLGLPVLSLHYKMTRAARASSTRT